ncbi:hypothetical protein HUT18_12750 [Streptomyces sp. NA04227]|uniref:gephyrin-like molybdotransferase receptor GlpR n=1 Tax=Streptomyces sp. NA04227 TaxID=2742136 RepID=UPI00159225F5|nr:gephyrin-like molybdotransferase receptor GlpR [Streptomyces sp. NA04227]QKW07139.1 hypothetical protein HUT18_12750 [Streptomyces sp. NA04227]
MSSSGLIYAVIVGAWAAYLVPMWLRRQDELNEARPTERFSTAIRLLSGRAGMERRYAKDLKARSDEIAEPPLSPGEVTDSVDVRAFAVPPRQHPEQPARAEAPDRARPARAENRRGEVRAELRPEARAEASGFDEHAETDQEFRDPRDARETRESREAVGSREVRESRDPRDSRDSRESSEARARRTQVLARRRRTTLLLFAAFSVGAVVAGVGGLAFLWAPVAPAVLLSVYIVHLRRQERRRYAYVMDRRKDEEAARRLRERQAARRDAQAEHGTGEPRPGPGTSADPARSSLAADRRALVEQTDHAEWVDQQRERRGPARGESWDPVPVPLPTYVTAPVAPRATGSVDLGAPDTWSAARSSAAEPGGRGRQPEDRTRTESGAQGSGKGDRRGNGSADRRGTGDRRSAAPAADDESETPDERSDARRAASARRARERGRTPLFDQYDEGGRPRAANE